MSRTFALLPTGLGLALLACGGAVAAPSCMIVKQQVFAGDKEKVRLARDNSLPAKANFGVFKAPMAVNTDGAPTSYHPDDFLGEVMAINRIDNGIAIRRADKKKMTTTEKIAVFDKWKASNWKVPTGFVISWKNVIAADTDGNPCIFKAGEHKGYFGSLTATTNGLKAQDSGECQVKNQLDQRFIPAIVLRGDANPLKSFGAKKGDLVLAINPATGGAVVPAIIGDTGDGNRIGEGSVALNMKLLGKSDQPKTYKQALNLDTGTAQMIVAVLPGSTGFNLKRPYTVENIASRVEDWAKDRGYASTDELAKAVAACAEGL